MMLIVPNLTLIKFYLKILAENYSHYECNYSRSMASTAYPNTASTSAISRPAGALLPFLFN
jgi:hypothetical protein